MKDMKLMNIILDMGKRFPTGFDKKTFYSTVESFGYKQTDANSFMLTNMKKAGLIDNPQLGVWVLTEYGKTLNYVDDALAEKIYKMREIKNRVKKKKLAQRVVKQAVAIMQNESKAPAVFNVADLIVEIKKANPKADISRFAAML
jgi:hydrogenase maturation factor